MRVSYVGDSRLVRLMPTSPFVFNKILLKLGAILISSGYFVTATANRLSALNYFVCAIAGVER